MADIGGGAVAVIGQHLYDDSDTGGAVAFVLEVFVAVAVAGGQRLVNGALDVVFWHIDGLGLGDDGGQLGVIFRVAAAAGLDGDDDLTSDLGKGSGTLGIGCTLCFLNIMPLGMSGHWYSSLLIVIGAALQRAAPHYSVKIIAHTLYPCKVSVKNFFAFWYNREKKTKKREDSA